MPSNTTLAQVEECDALPELNEDDILECLEEMTYDDQAKPDQEFIIER